MNVCGFVIFSSQDSFDSLVNASLLANTVLINLAHMALMDHDLYQNMSLS